MAGRGPKGAATGTVGTSTKQAAMADLGRDDRPETCELYELYRPMIKQFATRVLGPSDECEDVTQDVLIRIFRFLPSFGGRSRFSTWLYRVTYNTCMDYVKRRRSRPLPLPDQLADTTARPDDTIAQAEDRVVLLAALREIPPKYRQPLTMRFIADLPYAEIARRTGAPVNTLKVRVFRGRQLLRATLTRRAGRRVATTPARTMAGRREAG